MWCWWPWTLSPAGYCCLDGKYRVGENEKAGKAGDETKEGHTDESSSSFVAIVFVIFNYTTTTTSYYLLPTIGRIASRLPSGFEGKGKNSRSENSAHSAQLRYKERDIAQPRDRSFPPCTVLYSVRRYTPDTALMGGSLHRFTGREGDGWKEGRKCKSGTKESSFCASRLTGIRI